MGESYNMEFKDMMVEILSPHKETISKWASHQVEALFMGMGDISIFRSESEDYLPDEDISGTYSQNASAIMEALEEMQIAINFTAEELYWVIESCAGNIRKDMKEALESVGYRCFLFFNPDGSDKETHLLRDVNILTADINPQL